ncbi:hypothetical protein Pmani_033787 [Petrolisthes manimaculis]|uniref:Uncharacterized protein n=1 Tax=Petrolisthes manimaculis TaxID=1843537 RepID=A0AAE1NNQ5_9EUCA|nr:hypothetical protein Pmani_033787 [Petrolisthes manimaculis]
MARCVAARLYNSVLRRKGFILPAANSIPPIRADLLVTCLCTTTRVYLRPQSWDKEASVTWSAPVQQEVTPPVLRVVIIVLEFPTSTTGVAGDVTPDYIPLGSLATAKVWDVELPHFRRTDVVDPYHTDGTSKS